MKFVHGFYLRLLRLNHRKYDYKYIFYVKVTRCRRLLSPLNGFFFGPCDNIYGSKCTMGCDNGYRLDGSSSTTCVAKPGHLTGRWDQDFPVCRGKLRKSQYSWTIIFKLTYPIISTKVRASFLLFQSRRSFVGSQVIITSFQQSETIWFASFKFMEMGSLQIAGKNVLQVK